MILCVRLVSLSLSYTLALLVPRHSADNLYQAVLLLNICGCNYRRLHNFSGIENTFTGDFDNACGTSMSHIGSIA